MTVIKTCLGRYFDLAKPREQEYPIEEIAWHLAHINRFTGAAEVPVSVAVHSVKVSHHVWSGHRLAALLHDAEEAYYGDISSPAKQLVGAKFKRLAEEARMCAMEQNGVTQDEWADAAGAVHVADGKVLRIETMYYTAPQVTPHPKGFHFEAEYRKHEYWEKNRPSRRLRLQTLQGVAAADLFLERYYELLARTHDYAIEED
jgi:hypothetical protein